MRDSTSRQPTSSARIRGRAIRVAAAIGFGAALVTGVAGCTSSDDNSSSSSSATTVSTTPSSGEAKAVDDAFVAFFSGETSGAEKITLVENGEAFADTINAQADSPLSKSTTASVTNVDLDAPGHATVTYTISMNGQPALVDQMGEAVQVNGQWKVSQASFCALLMLEGNPPPVCAQPTVAPTTSPAPPS